MTRTLRRLTILSLLCALGAATPAHAGQIVYPSGTGIWVMNDDGSAKRQLVDATQVPSMEYLGDPSVQPNGTEVAFDGRWNQAYYEQNHWGPAPGMCGGNCEGIVERERDKRRSGERRASAGERRDRANDLLHAEEQQRLERREERQRQSRDAAGENQSDERHDNCVR